LKRIGKYGSVADELIEFVEDYPEVKQDLLNLFVVDLITNQEDRHSKNFGILECGQLSPIYDNGQSLYFGEPDNRLHLVMNEMARVKFLGKDTAETLKRYCDWLGCLPSVDLDTVLHNLDNIDIKYRGLITKTRLIANRAVVERRVQLCKELIS
jgi:hypothetical protein